MSIIQLATSSSVIKLRYYQEEAVQAMLDCTDNGVVVLPTGAGKTLVMREFVRRVNKKVLIISHVKEILAQNFECVASLGNVGLYSAGLRMQVLNDITVAGIQSIYKMPEMFRRFDVVLIDECHLINEEGMYRGFLDALGVPYIGLTATPFRLKQGYIYQNDVLFNSLIYDAPVGRLQKEGYLTEIRMEGSVDEMDTTGISLTGGDFNLKEMSLRFDREGMTTKIVESLQKYKTRYKHWLVFAIDIKHAEHIAKALNAIGVTAAAVHSQNERDEAIIAFKRGEIQALVNVNILTTGFDYPEIDFIPMLRPTKSPTLHVQALGRGLRVAEGKDHCLVKDFAGNTARLGFIDNLAPIVKKGKGKGGVNPFCKTCPDCEKINHPVTRVCECGYVFKFDHGLRLTPVRLPKWYDVDNVYYNINCKIGKPNSLRVTYVCGLKTFNTWVHIEHPGFAGHKAKYWVNKRWTGPHQPETTADLYAGSHHLSEPKRIRVDDVGKYPKILSTIF